MVEVSPYRFQELGLELELAYGVGERGSRNVFVPCFTNYTSKLFCHWPICVKLKALAFLYFKSNILIAF